MRTSYRAGALPVKSPRAFAIAFLRAVLTALLAFTGAAHALSVVDTGTYLSPYTGIFWLDDDRVIFGGYGGPRGVPDELRPGDRPMHTARFLEYRLSTGQFNDRGAIASGGPCADGGYVRYAKPLAGLANSPVEPKWQGFYGRYGEETAQPPSPPRTTLVRSWNCKLEDELAPLPEWTKGRQIRRLRPEHGFLEFEDSRSGEWYPVRIIRPGEGPSSSVPLTRVNALEFDWPPLYAPADRAYLIGSRRPQSPGVAPRYYLWRLFLDGRIEQIVSVGGVSRAARESTISPPKGIEAAFSGPVGTILPLGSRRFIFNGGAFDGRGNLNDSGLYVLEPSGIKKLVKGRVKAISLSPNGCKAAAGVDTQDPMALDQFRLHIVDACDK